MSASKAVCFLVLFRQVLKNTKGSSLPLVCTFQKLLQFSGRLTLSAMFQFLLFFADARSLIVDLAIRHN